MQRQEGGTVSQAYWVSTVTHTDEVVCPSLSAVWPQVVEQPIEYVAPGIALPPPSDYVCVGCGSPLMLLSRWAVGT